MKKLKDAGFPQRLKEGTIFYKDGVQKIFCFEHCDILMGYVPIVPTLSELIEACGEDFRWLKKKGHIKNTQWLAQGRPHPVGISEPRCYALTPEEAVAMLYLELKKK